MDRSGPRLHMLPRLLRGQSTRAVTGNAAGLLGTALVGAGLVHLLAYHVFVGVPFGPRWLAAVWTLLMQCPLVGPLGLIAVIVVLAPLLVFREMRLLEQLNRSIMCLLRERRATLPPTQQPVPRSLRRLLGFFAIVLGFQTGLYSLAGWLDPMQRTMVMGGHLMTMASTPTLPLAPLHVVVAGLLALALWRVEYRLMRVRYEVALRLRVLAAVAGPSALRAGAPTNRPTSVWTAPALFARPPPIAS